MILTALTWSNQASNSPDELNDEEEEHESDAAQNRRDDSCPRVVYRADGEFLSSANVLLKFTILRFLER